MDVNEIVKAAQLASILEVTGYPKPGNVHRTHDFEDMKYEDFLVSGVVIGDTIRKTALRASKTIENQNFSSIKLGELILEAVTETNNWVKTNTNLGIIMLFIPITAAAAISPDFNSLRTNIVKIMADTTPEDAVNLYKAINLAEAGGMGEQEDLDVASDESQKELIEKEITMFDVLEISAEWDQLAKELTTSMPAIFEVGYPTYKKLKEEYGYNYACVETFLKLLSIFPDTLISRKVGIEKAKVFSEKSKEIINNGSLLTDSGSSYLKKLDKELINLKLNPGTTADLTAASIMVAILSNY
jgi:triphosphoribosyl-dephospho-CoA synthase